MKYLFTLIYFSFFLFSGCVNTYTIQDFSSPQEFFDHLNEKAKDRTVTVKADSNKVYDADNLTVSQDSTFFITTDRIKNPNAIKSTYNNAEIQQMWQKDNHTEGIVHSILLKNGGVISSRSIVVKNDSVFLYDIIPGIVYINKRLTLPTSTINSISYNNHWIGIGEGALYYSMLGIMVAIRNADITSGDQGAIPPELAAIGGAIVFGLAGTIPGVAFGSYQEYIINPQNYNYHGFTSVRLLGGLNTSGLGVRINGANFSTSRVIDYSFGISILWSFNDKIGINSGIFYNSKGSSFDQYVPSESFTYHRDIFLDQLEIPILFQYTFTQDKIKPRIYAGPQIGIFRDGRIDNIYDIKEYFVYPPIHILYYRGIDTKQVNNPEYSIVIGAGVNLQKFITLDLQYNYGLSKFSNSLFDGQVTNLKLNSFSILMGFGF
jgi:hypothetical protein